MRKKTEKNSKKTISAHSIGTRIAYLRRKRDMTQTELAQKSKISQPTVAQIESDKKDPSLKTLLHISEALDVHISILFAADDVHIFNMKSLRSRYKRVDDLNETLYRAIGEVIRFAKDIGYI